jgi:hypothetical protein
MHAIHAHTLTLFRLVSDLSVDLSKMMESKTKTVTGLTGGIEFLFKKNKASKHSADVLVMTFASAGLRAGGLYQGIREGCQPSEPIRRTA